MTLHHVFQATRCILVISGCSGFSAFNISYRRTTFPPLLLHHSEQPNRQPDSLIENTFICYREDTSYAALHMPAACHSTSDRWWNPIKRQRSPEVTHYLATSPAPTPFCSLFRRSLSLSFHFLPASWQTVFYSPTASLCATTSMESWAMDKQAPVCRLPSSAPSCCKARYSHWVLTFTPLCNLVLTCTGETQALAGQTKRSHAGIHELRHKWPH